MSHLPLCLPAPPLQFQPERRNRPLFGGSGDAECAMIGAQDRPLSETVFGDSKVGSMGAGSRRNLPALHDKPKVTTFVWWKQGNCDAGHWAGSLTAEPADPPALPTAQRTPNRCDLVRGSAWSCELSADNLSIKAESRFHHPRRGQNGHITPPIICFSKPAASYSH